MKYDWQAAMDCDTLMTAEQIKKDPKRLKAAQEYAKSKLMNLAKVVGEEAQ
jgi:hypothetical protein